ncbi:hypothetical protein PHYBLDRAFT_70408 [Phycomyces blakesleeanus NRRL 1555(-)]|uniref:DDE Tnp4 domain-containing protein n=1 Tax=Phycomyces blakesleeanus (strain ATCC 8743b / DSM 1359 / FGSC 10004 / NBRC 33097 / NRRL 1555) TaxID=763407 RepID=A0A162TGY1_PHYB8|nr:hypothetical protein PHYBLDRAFT_70408 [Phycomyces blakesleeanus NRRL 1555(-)]OAD67053.1 hypothetical protein PHYBLDRAFT_70408 [Phycomyces blakesleeanus NRRL 1555(-)]|eukprot:XP_018285093.1 hypothetical protein PHYBLDRAFT_70408 [Phycomyces blakesleeanus NRRL 1555(-)]
MVALNIFRQHIQEEELIDSERKQPGGVSCNPSLGDTPHIDDIRRVVKENMFKEHYRITLSTFKTLFILAMSSIVIDNVITWPNTIKRTLEITAGFEQPTKSGKQRLKEVIGAIDGKLISIKKPTTANYGDSYADCKENISINLTAVSNYKKRFIHIATDTPGSLHDAHMLKLDLMYLLLPQLLILFIAAHGCRSENQEIVPLTMEQKLYNAVQSRTQQKIENTILLLVLRWKFLYKHLYLKNVGRLT